MKISLTKNYWIMIFTRCNRKKKASMASLTFADQQQYICTSFSFHLCKELYMDIFSIYFLEWVNSLCGHKQQVRWESNERKELGLSCIGVASDPFRRWSFRRFFRNWAYCAAPHDYKVFSGCWRCMCTLICDHRK